MSRVEHVGFKQVYDLVFRARNARLKSVAYVLDFYDWMKAGLAFNTRGFELNTRKISYFAGLYEIAQRAREEGSSIIADNKSLFEIALAYYYADIFEVYQDHVRSKHSEAAIRNRDSSGASSRVRPEFGNLLVLPAFDGVPELREVFDTVEVGWNTYECKDSSKFINAVASTYVKKGTGLFSCMSLMYDYGYGIENPGVLLEVKLWDKET